MHGCNPSIWGALWVQGQPKSPSQTLSQKWKEMEEMEEGIESASGDSGFNPQQQRKKKNKDCMQGSMAMSATLSLMSWVKYSFQRLTITKLIRVVISHTYTGRMWRSWEIIRYPKTQVQGGIPQRSSVQPHYKPQMRPDTITESHREMRGYSTAVTGTFANLKRSRGAFLCSQNVWWSRSSVTQSFHKSGKCL